MIQSKSIERHCNDWWDQFEVTRYIFKCNSKTDRCTGRCIHRSIAKTTISETSWLIEPAPFETSSHEFSVRNHHKKHKSVITCDNTRSRWWAGTTPVAGMNRSCRRSIIPERCRAVGSGRGWLEIVRIDGLVTKTSLSELQRACIPQWWAKIDSTRLLLLTIMRRTIYLEKRVTQVTHFIQLFLRGWRRPRCCGW